MSTSSRTSRFALLGAALGLASLTAGCRSGYEVTVHNLTDQPVAVSLKTAHTDGAPQALQSGRAGPGDTVSMFAQVDYGVHVWLNADFEGNLGQPAIMDLARGHTSVNVRRTDEGSRGRIRLEEGGKP